MQGLGVRELMTRDEVAVSDLLMMKYEDTHRKIKNEGPEVRCK